MLSRLGIESIEDLISYYPREYHAPEFVSIQQLPEKEGQPVVIRGKVATTPMLDRRPGLTMLKIALSDQTGSVTCVWFNQPYLQQRLKRGRPVTLTGRYSSRFASFNVEQQDLDGNVPPKIQPRYPLTEGLTNRAMERIMVNALKTYQAPELLPEQFRQQHQLWEVNRALQAVHLPENEQQLEQGLRRLKFEELFVYQLTFRRWRQIKKSTRGHQHQQQPALKRLEAVLGFSMTDDQCRAIEEITRDMASPWPMNRLLQGDVGSGKTAVAAYGLLVAALSGWKGVLMAPTEILARQHLQTLTPVAAEFDVPVALMTGSLGQKQRAEVAEKIGKPGGMIVVGTHATFQQDVHFQDLSLVITDEQHRFGVQQRLALAAKGSNADVLIMSATPIPRTLAMSVYGDLDITTLQHKPIGRREVKTKIVEESQRRQVFDFITDKMQQGGAGYIVCPLIEQSEKIIAASVEEYQQLLHKHLPSWVGIEVVHGRMDAESKEQAVQRIRSGQSQLMLATTVVEVGVDIPSANFIVIENSERYGLAQLHQLRGRVGRSGQQSWCFLISPPGEVERLKVLERTTDGFEIARADLELRGPGQYLGVRQHGLNEFKVAEPWRDGEILDQSRRAAEEVLPVLATQPQWRKIEEIVTANIATLKS